MSKTLLEVIHWGISVLIFMLSLVVFSGCSAKVVTEYKPVHIPVKCDVTPPTKPTATGDIVRDNLLILKYVEQLEQSLKLCI